jgi:lactoylglutathione lyase
MSPAFLHTMIRVGDLDAAMRFFCEGLGLEEVRRSRHEAGRFTLVFLAAPADLARSGPAAPMLELTHNWDETAYEGGRNFGHVAYRVDDIYAAVERFAAMGVAISRPPRDGRMAFVRSPDGISVELLQAGEALPPREPWLSAPNIGTW